MVRKLATNGDAFSIQLGGYVFIKIYKRVVDCVKLEDFNFKDYVSLDATRFDFRAFERKCSAYLINNGESEIYKEIYGNYPVLNQ